MKVYRRKKRWSQDEQRFHLIEKIGTGVGQGNALVSIRYEAYCGEKFDYRKGDESEYFAREHHTKRTLCMNCVRNYNLSRQKR